MLLIWDDDNIRFFATAPSAAHQGSSHWFVGVLQVQAICSDSDGHICSKFWYDFKDNAPHRYHTEKCTKLTKAKENQLLVRKSEDLSIEAVLKLKAMKKTLQETTGAVSPPHAPIEFSFGGVAALLTKQPIAKMPFLWTVTLPESQGTLWESENHRLVEVKSIGPKSGWSQDFLPVAARGFIL